VPSAIGLVIARYLLGFTAAPALFQLEVFVTIRQELIDHAAVRLAMRELGAEALPCQLSVVGSRFVALHTVHS
jgi:hypothetical protein